MCQRVPRNLHHYGNSSKGKQRSSTKLDGDPSSRVVEWLVKHMPKNVPAPVHGVKVSNLDANITSSQIEEHFESRGCAVQEMKRYSRDGKEYCACVHFVDELSKRRAIDHVHRTRLYGRVLHVQSCCCTNSLRDNIKESNAPKKIHQKASPRVAPKSDCDCPQCRPKKPVRSKKTTRPGSNAPSSIAPLEIPDGAPSTSGMCRCDNCRPARNATCCDKHEMYSDQNICRINADYIRTESLSEWKCDYCHK